MFPCFLQHLPRLETDRLILRQAAPGDAADIYAYASDVEVTRFLRWGPHRTLAETEAYLQAVLAEYAQGRDGPWMIALKPGQKVIGSIHLFEIDPQARQAQVGFVLAKAYWNQGIAAEALTQVLRFAFSELAFDRLEAWPIRENRAAIRVLEKAGMRPHGEPRAETQKGVLWDFCLYRMLRSDFVSLKI